MSVYLPTVAPGLNPGGLWMRTCAGEELIAEHAVDGQAVAELAEDDARAAREAATSHGEARTYLYDGDTGVCIATIITTPPPPLALPFPGPPSAALGFGYCPGCGGTGRVNRVVPYEDVFPCSTCGGSGAYPPEARP